MQTACSSVLLTDLYQLTMLQAYHAEQMREIAVFEFFVRRLPAGRNFLMAAGLEQVLDYLEHLQFTPEEVQWLADTGRFGADFLDSLAQLHFTGDVHAMPEGTVFFAEEPILRVTAPIPEAQLVESRIINLLHFQTLIASKAARCVLAAPGKTLVDFGMRRAHGAEAGLLAARASYLAGMHASATVAAGHQFGVPISGTMAHSYIQSHDDEETAFLRFAEANPGNVVLLLDTYDTERGAEKVVALADQFRAQGMTIQGVRLDSGDLAAHAHRVRRILDQGGLPAVKIFASGNLDEYRLEELVGGGVPIDGFGIGTRLDVSADVPALDCAYKLQEYAGRSRRKKSEGKATWPGRKQVFRECSDVILRDVVALEEDQQPGVPLLELVMVGGQRVGPRRSLEAIRALAAHNLSSLPRPLRRLGSSTPFQVEIAAGLHKLAESLDRSPPKIVQ